VNPALSFALEKLYGMKLPATVDLSNPDALPDLHRLIESQILTSEPGVRLDFSDKPRIKVLHQKVRRRLDQFNKRRLGPIKGKKARSGIRYSYDHPGFNPLGLQLFKEYVTPARAPNQAVMGRPLPRMFQADHMVEAGVTEREATVFQAEQQTEGRFNWSFDLCSVSLANFNYRKMSLVRDYDAMLDGDMAPTNAFDLLFDDRSYESTGLPPLPKPENRYPVIEMDPSQERSVLNARTGQSYVIQGPPGTGKSQTITNLIADFIGQGKRVLFVCEKRAALDVVFNRLTGIGLGSLCSMVHDSQQNKREFIEELDAIYTRWTEAPRPKTVAELSDTRAQLLKRIQDTIADIRVHVSAMTAPAVGTEAALFDVIAQALEAPAPELAADQRAVLPELADWVAFEDAVDRAMSGTKRICAGQSFSERPERLIAPQVWEDETALSQLPERVKALAARAKRTEHAQSDLFSDASSVGDAFAQVGLAKRVAPMAEVGQLSLLDPDSRTSRQFNGELRLIEEKRHLAKEAAESASAWFFQARGVGSRQLLRRGQIRPARGLRPRWLGC